MSFMSQTTNTPFIASALSGGPWSEEVTVNSVLVQKEVRERP